MTVARGVRIHLVAVYGFVDERYAGLNLHLLTEIGKHIELVALPFLARPSWKPCHFAVGTRAPTSPESVSLGSNEAAISPLSY